MKRDMNLYLEDILTAIKLIENYTKKYSVEKFKKDKKSQDAVIRRLEIIGEATKKISGDTKKKYPEISWKELGGIRNFLSHVYFGVNLDRIWKIVKQEIPVLKNQITKIKKELK